MHKCLKVTLIGIAVCTAHWAVAAPGEYWEMSVKMEMAGMPFAMPATTNKICVAKGRERDPGSTADKNCVVSDVKNSGNKSSWKVQCNHNGEIMNGSGEMTGTPDNSEGVIRLNGMSGGHKIDMTQTYKSRRIGGACDSDELLKKAEAANSKVAAQLCDTTGKSTTQMMSQSHYLLDEQVCPGKKQPFCDMLRRETSRDYQAYSYMAQVDKNNAAGKMSARCGVDLEATTRTICKTLNSSSVNSLAPYCPAEAKTYRDNERRKSCEGRSYTAREDLSKCLAGIAPNEGGDDDGAASPMKRNARTKAGANPSATGTVTLPRDDAPGMPSGQRANANGNTDANANPADALMESAKKLKGMFKF